MLVWGFRHQRVPAKLTTSTLKKIASFENLKAAWKALLGSSRAKSRGTSGIDGQSLDDFHANETAFLLAISRQLNRGTYAFSPLKAYFLTKPDGSERVICIPTTSDRIVQGAILHFLTKKYTTRFSNEVSYGFIKGRGVQEAVKEAARRRANEPWVFKTDIKAFFDTIPRQELKAKIQKTVRETSLHPLLFEVVDSEIKSFSRGEERRIALQGIKKGRGVRQGMPLSPFFSNVVLERFDNSLTKSGYTALRYADDLIFFADGRVKCNEMEKYAKASLFKEGFEIPPSGVEGSKSEIFRPADVADFLGVGLCRRPNGSYAIKVLPKQIDKIRESFMELSSVESLLSRGITLARLGGLLASKKSGYIYAYAHSDNLSELDNALDDIERKVLKTLYVRDLRIPTKDLSPAAYTFLGLGGN